ncbi:carbohydrate ABC transporter substrate-binding protein [Sagittula sp. NFXS13]|uniref:ABC transporter substrate-binding protein n=1 Tax=Sagittula sp. NFXS13 TaxID=2819095 RepID=UPI0032E00B1A
MTLTRRTLMASATVAAMIAGAVAPAAAQDEVTLTIANTQWLDALRGEKLWASVKKFEESHPNIKLEQHTISRNEFNDRLITEMGARQGPDIIIAQDNLFFTLIGADFLIPLDDVTEGVENLNATNDNAVVDGTRYGIGWHRAVYALIFNKSILEKTGAELPTDVDGLIAAAKAANEATGAIGFTGRHSMNEFSPWSQDFLNWAYGYGVELVDENGKITFDTPEMAQAFEAFKEVYGSGVMPIGDQMSTQRTRFKEQQVAFSIDNSGGSLNIATGGPLPGTDLGSAALPFPNPGAHQQIFLGVNLWSSEEEQAAAKEFLSWLISEEGQLSLRAASGPDALATDVPVTEEFVTANPWATTFAEMAESSRSTLIPGYEMETQSIMRPLMNGLEKVLLNAATTEDALSQAQAEIDADYSN